MGRQKKGSWVVPALVGALASGVPLILILYVLNGSELAALPHSLDPTGEDYSDGISLVSATSGTLVTIALAIIGAEAVWFFKESPRGLMPRILAYSVFLGCLISIYLGVKLSSWAGLTLASSEPDIVPLLGFLEWQALLVLCSGVLLSSLAIFSFWMSEKP